MRDLRPLVPEHVAASREDAQRFAAVAHLLVHLHQMAVRDFLEWIHVAKQVHQMDLTREQALAMARPE